MRSVKRIAAATTAAALVIGVGAALAAPAQAANNSQSGKILLGISPTTTSDAKNSAGLTFKSKKPKSTIDGSTGYTTLKANVTGTPADGAVTADGTWQIKSSITGQTISIVNPFFGYATGATSNEYQGAIAGVVRGLTGPYKYLNGRYETVFDLKKVTSETGWLKTKAIPGGFTRVSVTTTTGVAHMTSDNNLLAAFDSTIGSPWFQAGKEIGNASVTLRVLHSCKTAKACNKLG